VYFTDPALNPEEIKARPVTVTRQLRTAMGVPRLRQLLEPYAEHVDLKDRDLVIDGPGLAYHILWYDRRPVSSLFSRPSYSELGEAAVKWLNKLSQSGAKV